ncbi:MAG: beta-lactamase family protein [Kordiimonadaceae bacterium]|jgi:CubicO group peptidase (beta-lactamase class C family)|nr:beta-lactamase family protein [Kordiimonadaceae bacterium]MBT6036041.1 beta-lactamase family protein [Kordiimonadaceae bacterium]MBT6330305.1 beta-lactamase family protein [Kordiimonadaceae bacterium]
MGKIFKSLLLLIFIGPVYTFADEAELNEIFTPIIEEMMVENDIQGFVFSVVSSDGALFKKTYGIKNMYTEEPETNASLFHMASVTKTFVGTALMQLHDQGKLDVDKPVVDVVPYFRLVDNRYKDLTIRQFASHVSGMPDFDSNPWHNPQYDEGALERFVRDFISHKFLTHEPETVIQYCNTGYELLGDVIAKASGISFEDYVRENILIPAGMMNSTLLIQEADMTNLNSLHSPQSGELRVADVYPYNRMHGPSSTLISNIDDMARWVQLNLNGGSLDGNRILKKEILDQMWQPAFGKFDEVGFSWQRRMQGDVETIFHGGNDGFRAYIIMIPEHDIGFVWMSNTAGQPYHDFSIKIADKLIDYRKK